MKGKTGRLLSLVLAAAVAFGTLTFSTGNVYASGYTLSLDDTIWIIDGMSYGIHVFDSKWKMKKITAVTVSDDTLATINKDKLDGDVWWGVTPKKSGKVKVTVTFKTKSGKKKASKIVRIKKYPNQIKSLKVNGKKVSTKEYQDYYENTYKGTSVKVKAALKSGWKMTNGIYCYVLDKNGNKKTINIKKSRILNGKAIKFARKYKEFSLYFEMENKKNGDLIGYTIRLHR